MFLLIVMNIDIINISFQNAGLLHIGETGTWISNFVLQFTAKGVRFLTGITKTTPNH